VVFTGSGSKNDGATKAKAMAERFGAKVAGSGVREEPTIWSPARAPAGARQRRRDGGVTCSPRTNGSSWGRTVSRLQGMSKRRLFFTSRRIICERYWRAFRPNSEHADSREAGANGKAGPHVASAD